MWPSSPISHLPSPRLRILPTTTIQPYIIVSSTIVAATELGKFTISWLTIRDSCQTPLMTSSSSHPSESISKSNLEPQKTQHDLKKKNRARNKEDCKIKGYLSVQTSDVINNQISHPRLIFQDHMH